MHIRMSSRHTQPVTPPLRSRFAADPEMAELIDLFLAELPEKVGSLRTAVAASEAVAIRRLAHQLKGAAAMYGFPVLGAAAAALETRLLGLAEADEPRSELERVQGELDELIELCDRAWRGRH